MGGQINYATTYRLQCDYYFDGYNSKAKANISPTCVNNGTGGIFLWGDSHAQALSYGLMNQFSTTAFNQVATSGCRPLVKEENLISGEAKIACDRSNQRAQQEIIAKKPEVIILAQRHNHDHNNYYEIQDFLDKHGLSTVIILVGPVPQWSPSLPKAIIKRHFEQEKKYIKDPYLVIDILKTNDYLKERYRNSKIIYVSIIDELCNGVECLAKVDDRNTPLVWDYGHLTLEGSKLISKEVIAPILKFYLGGAI